MTLLAFCGSVRIPRLACRFLPVVFCVMAGGCSSDEDSAYELTPVKGTVRFKDGSIPRGELASIIFHPVDVVRKGKHKVNPAEGTIHKDGSFELKTDGQDGAVVGKHRVVIRIMRKYPPDTGRRNRPVVHPDYAEKVTTPLVVVVKSGKKFYSLEVKKP